MVESAANHNITLKENLSQYHELYTNGVLRQTLYGYLDEGIGWYLFPVCWFDENGKCVCGHKDKNGNPILIS